MTIKYGESTFGRTILVYESPDEFTFTRVLFIFGSLILGLTTILIAAKNYSRFAQYQRNFRSSLFLAELINSLFILTALFLSWHYVDHSYRSVYYHEPKWAHQRYLISTMEVPFILNILVFTFGVNAIKNLFVLDRNGLVLNRSACHQMYVFILGSILIFVHYTLEPPTNYGWDTNINISGTGFSGILLAVAIWYYHSQVKDK